MTREERNELLVKAYSVCQDIDEVAELIEYRKMWGIVKECLSLQSSEESKKNVKFMEELENEYRYNRD